MLDLFSLPKCQLYDLIVCFSPDPWPSRSWPSRCSTLGTWWPPATRGTDATSPLPASSEEGCRWRRWTNNSSTSRTRTAPTLLSGFPTMWRRQCVTSLQGVSKWLQPSSETQRQSKNSSRGFPSSSLPCSDAKLSFIGTQVLTICHQPLSVNISLNVTF